MTVSRPLARDLVVIPDALQRFDGAVLIRDLSVTRTRRPAPGTGVAECKQNEVPCLQRTIKMLRCARDDTVVCAT